MKSITDDRGQVGIGTLIVFIALVLVAAIAAGVLINTAGFLQTQAEETGQDSTDQVADNINLIGEVGEVSRLIDTDGDTTDGVNEEDINDEVNVVHEQRLTVQRSPGSADIDLTGLSIQYVGDNGFEQLIHISKAEADGSFDVGGDPDNPSITDEADAVYLVQEITAESDEDAVLTDDGDRYEIIIPLALAIDEDNEGLLVVDEDVFDADDTLGIAEPFNDPLNEDPTTFDAEDGYNLEDVEIGESVASDSNTEFDNTDLALFEEGQSAGLEITTEAGATRNVAISAPDTLIGEEGGTVTL